MTGSIRNIHGEPSDLDWQPTSAEVEAIVAEMRPLIDAMADVSYRRQVMALARVRVGDRGPAARALTNRARRMSAPTSDTSSSVPGSAA